MDLLLLRYFVLWNPEFATEAGITYYNVLSRDAQPWVSGIGVYDVRETFSEEVQSSSVWHEDRVGQDVLERYVVMNC